MKALRPVGIVGGTLVLAAGLFVASWGYILIDEWQAVSDLFRVGTVGDGWRFVLELAGLRDGPATPAFLEAGRWGDALALAYDTLVMSVLAITIATVGMALTAPLAVRPRGAVRPSGAGNTWRAAAAPALRWASYLVIRTIYVFARAVPELVWALIIIFVVQPGIVAGAIALAIHNFGIVGKLSAEVVEDLDPAPMRALASSGAGTRQRLLYGVLPQAAPKMLTYVLYRWEVIMRTTIVVGFVAASGLGREFRLSMSFFQFTDVALILLVYFLLVGAGDMASAGLRRLAR
ncbi:MAG: phosphonate transport system permease protein [Chloroflexi bacterium]|nr:MAG: phosphonate transport system permease protein [Chloroflexota bacterium]